MTNLIPLTDSIITSDLNLMANKSLSSPIVFAMLFTGLFIFWIVSLKKRNNSSFRKFYMIAIPIILLFLVIGFAISINNYLSIKNIADSNSWTVVNDKILETKKTGGRITRSGSTKYYIYLSKHGRVKVDTHVFFNCSTGDSAYVVITKDKNGNEQPTGLIYSQEKYIYKHD